MHGQFIREMTKKVDKKKTCQWLSRGDLKVGRSIVACPRGAAIRTNYMKGHINKISESPLCRLCGKKGESV